MDITYEQTFNGYPINTDREKEMGCYTKGLVILQDKLESMMEKHSKLLLTGVVLRYPQDGSVEPSPRTSPCLTKTSPGILKETTSCRKPADSGGKRGVKQTKPPSIRWTRPSPSSVKSTARIRIHMRTLSSWSTETPREIRVMFRKELPGLGKQHSVWRTVQAWYTIVKSLIFWTGHLRTFNKRSTTPFTITATRSKYEVRNIVVRGRGWFAEHGGAKGTRRKVAHPN